MRNHSSETEALLRRLQALVSAGEASLPSPADIVHYDFNPANILVVGPTVSGVVDWEGVRAGDRAFDLATLLFYVWEAPPTRTLILGRLDQLRPRPVIGAYVAHVILRQVEWSLRFHTPEISGRYLRRAHAVLKELEAD